MERSLRLILLMWELRLEVKQRMVLVVAVMVLVVLGIQRLTLDMNVGSTWLILTLVVSISNLILETVEGSALYGSMTLVKKRCLWSWTVMQKV